MSVSDPFEKMSQKLFAILFENQPSLGLAIMETPGFPLILTGIYSAEMQEPVDLECRYNEL
jgi:hypothetical protein